MKINKITLAIMVAGSLLAVSPAVHAQTTNETGGAAAPARRARGLTVDAIDKAVTLTDAEKPKVKDAVDAYNAAVQEARSADQDERRTKMQAARQDLDGKMKDILTPDQYTKFQAMRPARRGGAGGGAGGGATPPPPANPPAGNQ
jgi:protein CpxP